MESNLAYIGMVAEVIKPTADFPVGWRFVIHGVSAGSVRGKSHDGYLYWVPLENLIIKGAQTKLMPKTSLLEKAVLAVTPEPQKSFRRAGITNGDGLLTDDGVKVFLSYLLDKNKEDFKTAVVDPILAQMKE